jgi:conjugal transfer pilus assembly protein TraD
MSLMNFEDPFRPAYESYAAGAWGAAAIAMGLCEVLSPLPSGIFAGIAVLSVGMFIRRTLQAARIEKRQQHMDGVPLTFMPRKALANIIDRHPDKIFLGYGFPWSREEAQVVHTLKRHDPERLYPRDTDIKGQRWIHGLGVDREREVLLPFDHAGGMTFILGTTGSGKTRMLDTVITQMIACRSSFSTPSPTPACSTRSRRPAGRLGAPTRTATSTRRIPSVPFASIS